MFEMTQVTKAYRTDLLETHALREFSLKVDKGEFVAVTGPSGSGKTTIVNAVAGILRPEHGKITLDGLELSSMARADFRKSIALVPQDPVIFALSLIHISEPTRPY